MYCRALDDIGERPLRFAFESTLRSLGEFMPSIAQIRAYADQWQPPPEYIGRRFRSVEDIDPAKCPKGWTPEQVFAAHLTQEKSREASRR